MNNRITADPPSDGMWAIGVVFLIYLVSFIIWIWQIIRLSKRKNKTHMWLILVLGIVTIFVLLPIWAGIGLFLGRDKEEEEKEEEFYCGMCHIKYKKEMLGGETLKEGKICRWCLDKKQRGEK
ncbi:MAG: hypothetical protein I3273_01700 [Candidatus Moeniiplasma glomeromycotorum]|nr:hypothetical protein [Candidatus Moeniiplasma glomeromycotorum]MCE8167165.1 hypothetical protein [Candidatus Moeniiplasma glomeromycotorum]MCE8168823.1 hypothetical protein [Candidatus Moeniiplasma glomeromycotorum]